jgi:hypothetical protein
VGGWLALTALALQLVVSFAHVHPEDFLHAGDHPTIVTQAGGAAGVPGDIDHDHRGCAICATIHHAAKVLLPTPPAIIVPARIVADPLPGGIEDAVPSARALAFDARGPPRT